MPPREVHAFHPRVCGDGQDFLTGAFAQKEFLLSSLVQVFCGPVPSKIRTSNFSSIFSVSHITWTPNM